MICAFQKKKKRFLDLLLKSKRIKNTHRKCWHWKHLLGIDSWFQTNCLEQRFSNVASQYDHLWRFLSSGGHPLPIIPKVMDKTQASAACQTPQGLTACVPESVNLPWRVVLTQVHTALTWDL